jgi:hypothetical protein
MRSFAAEALLGLQLFHVLFLTLHDWIPLGPLNDVKAVRAENPGSKLLIATLISGAPFLIAFVASVHYFGRMYPSWLFWLLWIAYIFLFIGELQAWWVPYFFGAKPERVARYEAMFGRTNSFLPPRNGIRINTLHVILHAATVCTLICLALISF